MLESPGLFSSLGNGIYTFEKRLTQNTSFLPASIHTEHREDLVETFSSKRSSLVYPKHSLPHLRTSATLQRCWTNRNTTSLVQNPANSQAENGPGELSLPLITYLYPSPVQRLHGTTGFDGWLPRTLASRRVDSEEECRGRWRHRSWGWRSRRRPPTVGRSGGVRKWGGWGRGGRSSTWRQRRWRRWGRSSIHRWWRRCQGQRSKCGWEGRRGRDGCQ